MNVVTMELPAYEIAYVRHVGHYLETYHAWGQLMQWAIPNELHPPQQHFIGISHDDPHAVAAPEFRYDACVTLPLDFDKAPHTDVQFTVLPGGLYAKVAFYDSVEKLNLAYQHLFGAWLPASEFEADDRPHLEFSLNNPGDDPEGKAKVDLYIAIKKRPSR